MSDKYSLEVLAEVEDFAYRYMQRGEIAIITGVDEADIGDQGCHVGQAFLRGRLKRKAELNGSIIQLTKQLSSPAMAIEYKIAEQTYLNDLK
jgi:glutamate synthase domain-containing protein 3